jgi:hypothetical protein
MSGASEGAFLALAATALLGALVTLLVAETQAARPGAHSAARCSRR